ncbi:VOC family protein [Streptomyces sp. NPDC052236]|uniref:VOC family protein n=1 Tax=Streptomyces sp. NPDC052236 TaxID=3365686 RepID=UPI0037D5AC05
MVEAVPLPSSRTPRRKQGTEAPPVGGLAGSPAFLFVYVEHVDAVVARAVELGATLKRAPENQFYGDRDGSVVDPYGHTWTVATHVEDVAPEEMARRMAAMQEQGGLTQSDSCT